MSTDTTPEITFDEIRDRALALIPPGGGERYSPTRYPYTYSADFLRAHPQLIPVEIYHQVTTFGHAMSRAEAAKAKWLWSEVIGVSDRALAEVFADCYLVEHGIPLANANADRAGSGVVG